MAIALFSIVTVHATTLIQTDVAEMSREARTIAVGRVVAVDARWTADRRRIDTLVTLQADTYLKGSLGSQLQFVMPGGQIGRVRNLVVGAPRLAVGQRIVVFLGGSGPSLPFILGFNQGLFRVVVENGGQLVAPAVTDGPQRVRMRLDDFARHVRALAAKP
jgi:hypothetical protein